MYRRILLIVLLGTTCVYHSWAQQSLSVSPAAVGVSNTGNTTFYYGDRQEPPRAIVFQQQTVTTANFLANINRYLEIPAEFNFTEVASNSDNLGMRHYLLQQNYKGIPVEGMNYRVHEKNGFVTSANGKAVRNIKADIQTSISEETAYHLAAKHVNGKDSVLQHGRKLIVSKDFTFAPESFYIAFQFDIDVSFLEQWRISIDARSGKVINKVSLVNSCHHEPDPPLPYGTGTGMTNYYGSQTIRVEKIGDGSKTVGQTEHGGVIRTFDFRNENILALLWFFEFFQAYEFYSSDNTYNDLYQKPAVSVQWAAEKAFEYYFNKHNRNSFDNNGSEIKSYVHVDRDLNNAFWTRNLMAFGDGSNNNPLVQLDVVAHELTHGVTQFEAGLQYYNEPGALNESFSDILGKAVEFDTFGDTASWQLAKHYRQGGLRDMSNPNLQNQPDTYNGNLWFTGYEDNGGVHYNSGVQNYWFYLLCEGGTGVNDHQANYSINSIGIEAASKIVYRNLTEYLSSYSDYLDSRIGSVLATADLYGTGSAVYQEVDKAWDAVGVIDEPIITNLELYDITATTVKVKGSLLPRGNNVTYHFEYGTTPTLGSASVIYNYTGKVEGLLTGLQSQTKYYFRLVATNENGPTYFNSEFTTLSLAPLVQKKQTVDITETTAILYARINPNSLVTSYYFEYGPTPAFGFVTPTYSLSAATEFLNVSVAIANLQPRKTYYYRLVATNGFASRMTDASMLFTAVKPVINSFAPATAPIGTEVTITGRNFNSLLSGNIVTFGATRATVVSASTTEVKVLVPMGASLGLLSILDSESGLVGESVQEFVPTFTGESNNNSLQLTFGINDIAIRSTIVKDIDGDKKPDIVGIHNEGFSIFQNVNQGGVITNESFIRNTYNIPDFNMLEIYVVDIDGNGLPDIIGQYPKGFRVYPNFSVPGYVFFGTPVELPLPFLSNIIFNDLDMDGHIDLAGVTVDNGTHTFTIFRNQSPKGYLAGDSFEQKYTKILPSYIYALASADLNNDGKTDLISSGYNEQFYTILKNVSQPGAFVFEQLTKQDLSRGAVARYLAVDLNETGWKDLISYTPTNNNTEKTNLGLHENARNSSDIIIVPPVIFPGDYPFYGIRKGDINGDGKIDLVASASGRRSVVLENKTAGGERLTALSFQQSLVFGMELDSYNSGIVEIETAINDLNGDGRPEIINANTYYYGPHDGYLLEIWQNAPGDCPDASRITVDAGRYTATVSLPANTTVDQFDMEYLSSSNNYWIKIHSTRLDLYPGQHYRLRARAVCHLGFTSYSYFEFDTDCLDKESFVIDRIDVTEVNFNSPELYSIEVQYSVAGKNEWIVLPQYSYQISNLLPGTTYDLRFKGLSCGGANPFNYKQFTTLCPMLSYLAITNVTYNEAVVNWTSNYTGDPFLEYSADNTNWIPVDETNLMSGLTPGHEYFVRGKLTCTNVDSDFMTNLFTTPCPIISDLSVGNVTPFEAPITWRDESNTGTYSVRYKKATGGSTTTVKANSTSFTLVGLEPGTRYIVSVAATCEIDPQFTEITFNTVCYVPYGLTANGIGHTNAELSWKDNFMGSPYVVEYSIAESNSWLSMQTTSTNISLANLRPGTEYEARVHITCPSVTAQHISLRFRTDLYERTVFAPNPTENKLMIYPSQNLIGNYFSIQDNAGRIIAEGRLQNYTLDLSNFLPGIYTMRVAGEKPVKIVKR